MIVEGTLGSQNNLHFAIDTGAARTTIDLRLARRLGLKGKSKSVAVVGEKVPVQEVFIPQLCVGEACFAPVLGWVADLSVFRFRLDGLVGLDLLRQSSLTLDFVNNKLRFGTVSHSPSSQRFYGRLPYLPLRVNVAGETLCMILDSGGGEILLFEKEIRDSVSLERTGKKTHLVGAGINILVEEVLLRELRVGVKIWPRKVAYLVGERQYGNIEGIIGLSALELERLNLDFENNLLSWE